MIFLVKDFLENDTFFNSSNVQCSCLMIPLLLYADVTVRLTSMIP